MATPSDRPCPVCGGKDFSHFADEYIDPGKMGEFSFASRKTPEFMRPRLVCEACSSRRSISPSNPEAS